MRSEEVDLLGDIYGAALHCQLWPAVLQRLATLVGGIGGALLLRDKDAGEPLLLVGSSHLGAEADETYRARLADFDPHLALLDAAPAGSWITLSEHVDASSARNALYQDFPLPHGARHVVGVRLVETDALLGYMTIHRAPEQAAFGPAEFDRLRRIGPHLQRAAEIHCRFVEMRLEHTAGRAALDYAAMGIALVDGESRLLYANPAATALLKEKDGLGVRQGRLEASRNFERARLGTLVADAIGAGDRGAMLIGRPDGRAPISVHVLPAGLTECPHTLGPQASALVLLSDLQRPTNLSARRLKALFGLTEAEAAVAQEIMNGARVERIATARGTSVATVRTQVRSLLEKVGADGLAELIRILNGLPRLTIE